jgi:O-antigen/teichoic acid export membrane protein
VLGLLTVNIVANYQDDKTRDRMILELEKLAVLISGGLLLVTAVSGPMLQHFFHFDSSWPFVALALAVAVTVPLTFRNAFLRGKRYFGLVSLAGILAAGGDLVLSIIFVLFGWSTTGAIAGLVVAQFLAFWYAAYNAKRFGFSEAFRNVFKRPDIRFVLPELKYAALVLVGSLTVTGLYSIDALAIKHFFDAHTAGLYAGVSTIARIIFFLTASIAQVLMPSIKLHHSVKTNQQTLLKSFILLTVIGGGTLLAFTILPDLIIKTLMGATYLPFADLLPRLSLALFIISLLNLFIMYHMALRRYMIMPITIAGVAVTCTLLSLSHETLQQVINSLLYGGTATLVFMGVWLGSKKRKQVQV